jgi:RNA polymerase sigma factor (sigma-70 family)
MPDPSDAELLRAWKVGDKRSGARLYHRHAGTVDRFFRTKVAEADIGDLMQATFMTCFEHAENFKPEASFRAFLLGVARNLLLHHYRSRYRKHDKVDFGVSSILDIGVRPSAIIAEQQDERRLLNALRSLPLEQQILLELYYWEGMQGRELAELYGRPEGTIRTQLRRARQQLSATFEQLDGQRVGEAVSLADLDHWAEAIRARLDRA